MEHFAHSFIITTLHSAWQAFLILSVYYFANKLMPHTHPAAKRDSAILLLLLQVFVSLFTFLFIYFNNSIHINGQWGAWVSFSGSTLLNRFSGYLIVVYFGIVFLKLLFLFYQWYQFKKHCGNSLLKPGADISFFTHAMAKSMGITKRVKIWHSPHIHSPLTYGFLKPVILLPISLANHLTIEETEALIIHELAHIKQNDFLLNWILLIIETLYFFNPFIKLLASEIRKNRELSCDVEVMKKYYSPLHYANALYKSAAQHLFANAFSITAAQKEGLLLHRILFFTDTNNHFLPKRRSVIVPLLSLTFITLLLAVILPSENKEIKTVSASFIRTALPFNSEISIPEILSTDYVVPTLPKITVSSKSRSNTVAVSQTASKEKRTKPTGEIEHDAYYNLVPVNYIAQADSVTEIIVSEETAGGNSITRSYKMSYKNGKWEMTLLWMVENKKAEDSVHQNIDTTLQHYY
ncbi:MAG: M56 family metallopeptidase [Ferruginibacter sp.]